MATATHDPNTDSSAPAPAVPNFREDERLLARYATMLDRRKKAFFVEHESSVRRNASTKRDELGEQLEEAQAEWDRRKAVADQTREAYRAAYPQHVKKLRLVEPSGLENLRSMGAANKLYRAAEEAWRACEQATSTIRKLEHNESQLDVELEKALERAPTDALALLCLSALYGQTGKLDEVVKLLAPHEASMQRDVRLAHNYFEALFQSRDMQKITALLNKLATSPVREVKQFAIDRSRAISQMLAQQQQALAAGGRTA